MNTLYQEGDTIDFSFNQLIRATKMARITLSKEQADLLNTFDGEEPLLAFVESATKNNLEKVEILDVDYDEVAEDDFSDFEIVN